MSTPIYRGSIALLTARRPPPGLRWLDADALLVGLTAGLFGLALGMESLGKADGTIDSLTGVMGSSLAQWRCWA